MISGVADFFRPRNGSRRFFDGVDASGAIALVLVGGVVLRSERSEVLARERGAEDMVSK